MRASRFTLAAAVLALLACPLAIIAPFALNVPPGPRGGISLSGLVGGIFAGYNVYAVWRSGRPHFAAAVMATVFGVWLILAPLQYDVDAPMIATTQFAGMVLASFGGFSALEAVQSRWVDAGERATARD